MRRIHSFFFLMKETDSFLFSNFCGLNWIKHQLVNTLSSHILCFLSTCVSDQAEKNKGKDSTLVYIWGMKGRNSFKHLWLQSTIFSLFWKHLAWHGLLGKIVIKFLKLFLINSLRLRSYIDPTRSNLQDIQQYILLHTHR